MSTVTTALDILGEIADDMENASAEGTETHARDNAFRLSDSDDEATAVDPDPPLDWSPSSEGGSASPSEGGESGDIIQGEDRDRLRARLYHSIAMILERYTVMLTLVLAHAVCSYYLRGALTGGLLSSLH